VQHDERRIVFLEGRIEEQVMRIDDVREAVMNLEERINRRFELLEQRLDQRFGDIDRRFDRIDARFGRVYGLLIGMLIAIISGMGGIIAAILHR
jgi:tetrahydromethanopterin S-methyltransferase subunit G